MTNTSATGGYLAPNPLPPPLNDEALTGLFQQIVVGISGLPGSLVRPRWQATPPEQPNINTDWIAVGLHDRKADTFPWLGHNPSLSSGDGADVYFTNEELEVLCSFYGPSCDAYACLVRDGIYIPQNREALVTNGMNLISCGPFTRAAYIANAQWYGRVDMMIYVRRGVLRTYPVLNLLSAEGTIHTSDTELTVPFTVTET